MSESELKIAVRRIAVLEKLLGEIVEALLDSSSAESMYKLAGIQKAIPVPKE